MLKPICGVPGCEKQATVRRMCPMHYQRVRKYGDAQRERQPPRKRGQKVCKIDGCEKYVTGFGWCSKHYTRWIRYQDPVYRLPGEVVDGKRVCPRCRIDTPLNEYYRPDASYCVVCTRLIRNARRPRDKDRFRRWPASCAGCGMTFTANQKRRKYCSRDCGEKYRNRDNWKHVVKRRARTREVFDEMVDRREIFHRDNWICQLCGLGIDPALTAPNLWSASLDHIIPLARGGRHSRANTQASHAICNSRKGVSIQLTA